MHEVPRFQSKVLSEDSKQVKVPSNGLPHFQTEGSVFGAVCLVASAMDLSVFCFYPQSRNWQISAGWIWSRRIKNWLIRWWVGKPSHLSGDASFCWRSKNKHMENVGTSYFWTWTIFCRLQKKKWYIAPNREKHECSEHMTCKESDLRFAHLAAGWP